MLQLIVHIFKLGQIIKDGSIKLK